MMYAPVDTIAEWLPIFLLVFIRISAMAMMMPIIGYIFTHPLHTLIRYEVGQMGDAIRPGALLGLEITESIAN